MAAVTDCDVINQHESASTVVDGNVKIQCESDRIPDCCFMVNQPLLHVYPPLSDCFDDMNALGLLKRLDRLLVEASTTKKFDAMISKMGEASGVRHIQGARVEVFCRARYKQCAAFDWLCKKLFSQEKLLRQRKLAQAARRRDRIKAFSVSRRDKRAVVESGSDIPSYSTPDDIKKAILAYAVKQAQRDPRIDCKGTTGKRNRSYLFDNFSLIVNYDKVNAQPVHIDLQAPNHQFGMILTDRVPCTLEYQPEYKVRSVADLKRAWPDLPDTLAHALAQRESATSLLREFGDLLCPTILPVKSSPGTFHSDQLLRTGTLMSLPGSIMHAGPSCVGYRAVMFFTAWPKGHDGDADKQDFVNGLVESSELDGSNGSMHRKSRVIPPYNPDTQYWASLLISDMTSSVWDEIPNNTDRIYLLTKLADAVEISLGKNLHCHLSDPEMQSFTKCVEQKAYPRGQRSDYIAKFVAESESKLQPIGFGFFDDMGEYIEKLSVDNLFTSWDGKRYNMHVYRFKGETSSRDTNEGGNRIAVCIYYTADASWEGIKPDEVYLLTMALPSGVQKIGMSAQKTILFDGTNGVLHDCEGAEIQCTVID